MAFWDFLRPLTDNVIELDFATRVIVFLISLGILGIALLAYQRSKSNRFLFVSVAFLLFAVKLALKVIDLYISPGEFFHRAAENIFELAILVSLALAIFRK